jgi:hypothetical protein
MAPPVRIQSVTQEGEKLSFTSVLTLLSSEFRMIDGGREIEDKARRVKTGVFEVDLSRDGVIMSVSEKYNYDVDAANKHVSGKGNVEYVYDELNNKHIPLSVTSHYEDTSGLVTDTTLVISDVKLEPAPLAIFSVEGMGLAGYTSKNTWIRRITLVLVGIACVAAYIYFRRRTVR